MTRALLCVLVLTACCLSGCAQKVTPSAAFELPKCPVPPAPELPELDATRPLDSVENLDILMTRDDAIRAYIAGLRATVNCYETQRK